MVSADIETWRHRLYDISWFMRNLNETIARRANAEDGCSGHTADETPPTPKGLLPFIGRERIDKPQGLPFSLTDYLQLTDWTGRAIRDDKSGAIPNHLAPILERLNIDHVIPANAGIQGNDTCWGFWIPAFAGMTVILSDLTVVLILSKRHSA
ncbi:MAG: hypothetical protein KZQ99_01480 [Candidatus Thiodiazotropha sp. (ex Dulcina madagascariensis)]|nr:hypothetical protein [Candidatus Thiodiazotropha sp. (ex Dulcina madagascariensis)]